MTNFIALYRGPSVPEARLIAVSSEPDIVGRFISELVGDEDEPKEQEPVSEHKPLRVVRSDEE